MMTLVEFYQKNGGNYDSMISRMRTDERILKFLKMLPSDTSMQELADSMQKADCATAFRAAHTLHGLCLNMGLGTLEASSKKLTENLRPLSFTSESQALYEDVKKDYDDLISSLNELLGA